jgi:hypothetical protein
MRVRFGLAFAVAGFAGLASGTALASTVYDLDLQSGSTRASGTITTDSTLGALATSDILNWHIVLDTGAETFTLNGPSNSEVMIVGDDLTATAAGLFFDFSGTGHFILQNPAIGSAKNYLCFNDSGGNCSLNPSLVAVHTQTAEGTFSIGSGVQQIATVDLTPTPLPPSLLLFLSALGGLGVVGWRRVKATA